MSMTESEATKLHVGIIGSGRKYPMSFGEYMDSIEELKQYRAIGTVSEFRELKEKATAKKPIDREYHKGYKCCGSCGKDILWRGQKFCFNCGTEFDWSEGKG